MNGALNLNGTLDGSGNSGTLTYKGSSAFPTTGTSTPSKIIFDTANYDQTVSNRDYSGITVQFDNSGSRATGTITLGDGAGQTLRTGAISLAPTVNNIVVDGSVYNPTVSSTAGISGSASLVKNLNLGSGTWKFSGSPAFTNINSLTAPASSTILFNGSSQTLTGASKTFNNLDFSAATAATISGNVTSTGNVTLGSGMTLTGVTLLMTSTSATLVGAGNTLPNLTINPASAGTTTLSTSDLTISGTLDVGSNGTLSIGSGRTLTESSAGTLTLNGTIAGSGDLIYQSTNTFPTGGNVSSTLTYDATAGNLNVVNRTYGGLVKINNSGGTAGRVVTLGTTSGQTLNFSNGLTLLASGASVTSTAATYSPVIDITGDLDGSAAGTKTFVTGTSTLTVSGNVNFTNTTLSATSSHTLVMSGSSKTLTSNSNTLQNLTISGNSNTLADNLAVAGDLDLSGSGLSAGVTTITMTSSSATLIGGGNTVNNLTASSTGTITATSSDLIVGGTFTIATSTSLSINSGRTITASTTLILNGTSTGAGRLTYLSTTTFPTNGTVSSILRFDSTNNNQTMPGRTYGGLVEVYASSASARTITMATGTYAFSTSVQIFANGSGSTTLDSSTNSATGTISGNLTYSGSGSGSEIATFSVNALIIAGNLDISAGTFTAPSGALNLGGNYTNTGGTFTHNSGTVILNGSSSQTMSGTMSGGSAFNNLTIVNNTWNNPDTTPSVTFNATTTVNGTFTDVTPSSSIQFIASSTFTAVTINLNGGDTTTRVYLRSTIGTSTTWLFNVSGSPTVSNVDVKDSNALGGSEIDAGNGSNNNAGNNSNWSFGGAAAAFTSSTADDVFEINQASTTISDVNTKAGSGANAIASTTDIRLAIASSSFAATWDTSISSITCSAGNACAKISTTGVTYEASNSKAVIDVIQNFSNGDWVRISGLKMGNFTAVNAATSSFGLRVAGAASGNAAVDSGTKIIKGKLAEQNHPTGQEANLFSNSGASITNAELYRFRLANTGENITITTTTINITGVSGFASSNITNARLYLDANSNGVIDEGEQPVGATGTVAISGNSGTIVLGGSWTATTSDIILRADVSNINSGYYLTLSLSATNIISSGVTSLQTITVSGSAANINHAKPNANFGGGGNSENAASGGAPPGSGSVSGGTPPGGSGEGGDPGGGGTTGGGPGGGGNEGGGAP